MLNKIRQELRESQDKTDSPEFGRFKKSKIVDKKKEQKENEALYRLGALYPPAVL